MSIGFSGVVLFQPTPAARRVTTILPSRLSYSVISTHTLRKEGDQKVLENKQHTTTFQPTPSARRVTFVAPPKGADIDISTHTLRKEGDGFCG